MTRDELLVHLAVARQVFDDKLALVPNGSLKQPVPGFEHSIAQLVGHVAAYDRLVVNRLESAGHGAMTQLPADHDPERYEASTWTYADKWPAEQLLRRAAANFQSVVSRLREVADAELVGRIGAGGVLDKAWLQGRPPWMAIYDDTAGHYREHELMLDEARVAFGPIPTSGRP